MQQRRLPFSRASLLLAEERGDKQDEDRQGLLAKYAAHGNSYVMAKHAHRRRRMEEDEKERRNFRWTPIFYTRSKQQLLHYSSGRMFRFHERSGRERSEHARMPYGGLILLLLLLSSNERSISTYGVTKTRSM